MTTVTDVVNELIRWDKELLCLELYGKEAEIKDCRTGRLELKGHAPLSHLVFKIDIDGVEFQVGLYLKSVEIEDVKKVVNLARLAYMKLGELRDELSEEGRE